MTQIVLDLPPELADALDHITGRDANAITDILRDAVNNRGSTLGTQQTARFAPVCQELSKDLDQAVDWRDLHNRLRKRGFQLTPYSCGHDRHNNTQKAASDDVSSRFAHIRLQRRLHTSVSQRIHKLLSGHLKTAHS